MMQKEEIYQLMNSNPVFQIATAINNQPHVRNVLLYKADDEGIIFHTAILKDLHKELSSNPNVELCFFNYQENKQVRVSGEMKLVNDDNLKQEIVAHPSRAFLKDWVAQDPKLEGLAVYKLSNGKAHYWTMERNFAEKEITELA